MKTRKSNSIVDPVKQNDKPVRSFVPVQILPRSRFLFAFLSMSVSREDRFWRFLFVPIAFLVAQQVI